MNVDVDRAFAAQPVDLAWAVIDASPDGMIVTDAQGTIVLANHLACEMFGYTSAANSLVNHKVDELLPPSLRAAHQSQRERYTEKPRRRDMGSGLELFGRRSDGSEFPVEVSLSPISIDGKQLVIAVVRDVTAKRATDASLHDTRAQLARVGERERIGRDLHDSIIQRLYGAGLALDASLGGDEAHVRDTVRRVTDEIDATIREIRSVVHDLRSDPSEGARLQDRVRYVVEAQALALGIEITLHVVGRPVDEVNGELTTAVLAVIRECIANAHRHGRASHIVVDLESGLDGWFRVVVTDDGAGFGVDAVERGYGLRNIQERARDFGGMSDVSSRPGFGTTVTWQIPEKGDRSLSTTGTFGPA